MSRAKSAPRRSKTDAPPTPQRSGSIWYALLIAASGLIAYANSFDGAFVLDDRKHILNAESIKSLDPPWKPLIGQRRPIVNLTLAINYAVGRTNPAGYHVFNTAVHVAASLTLFGVIRRTLRRAAPKASDGTRDRVAVTVALFWCIHPLQTESVTYIIQRAESMMGLFYLWTLYGAIRGLESARPWPWYAASLVSCALGMGCKAVMITAPLVVLLYDWTFSREPALSILSKRWWYYLLQFGSWFVLVAVGVVRSVLFPPTGASNTVGLGFAGFTPLEYARTQPEVLLRYLQLTVWPAGQCLDYGWPIVASWAAATVPALIIVALLLVTIVLLARRHWGGFVGSWFFVILAPTSSFIPIKDVIYEHRMYLPLAAVLVVIVVIVRRLLASLARLVPAITHAAASPAIVAAAAIALLATTVTRNVRYDNEIDIWRDVLSKRPGNARAYNNLGYLLEKAGDAAGAEQQYRNGIEVDPRFDSPYVNLANVLFRKGTVSEAIEYYRKAIALDDTNWYTHYNLAVALRRYGDLEAACGSFSASIKLNGTYYKSQYDLASVLSARGLFDDAVEHYKLALALSPRDPNIHCDLGNAYLKSARLDEAMSSYRSALQIKPTHVTALCNLGVVHESRRELDEAVDSYRRVLTIEPANLFAIARLEAIQTVQMPDTDGP